MTAYKFSSIEKNGEGLVVHFKKSTGSLETLGTLGREPETPSLGLRIAAEDLATEQPRHDAVSEIEWARAQNAVILHKLESQNLPTFSNLPKQQVQAFLDRGIQAGMSYDV